MERDLLTKQIEQSALAVEEDAKSRERKEAVDREVDGLKRELDRLHSMWMEEKEELGRTKAFQEKLDAARRELVTARKRGDLAKAAELQHSVIPTLEHEMMELENRDHSRSGSEHRKMLAVSANTRRPRACCNWFRICGIPFCSRDTVFWVVIGWAIKLRTLANFCLFGFMAGLMDRGDRELAATGLGSAKFHFAAKIWHFG